MSSFQGANLYTQGFGSRPENIEIPTIQNRAPTSADANWPIGKNWVFYNNASYQLVGISTIGGSASATWNLLGTDTGALNTLTGDSGGAISPSAGNINTLGTANQIVTTGSGSTITWSIASTFIAPGSIASTTTLTAGSSLTVTTSATIGTTLGVTGLTTLAALTQVGTTNINASGAATTNIATGGTGALNLGNATGNTAVTGSLTASTTLTATLGNITATNGNLVLASAGNKLLIHATTAANDSVGTGTLNGSGTVTISTTACTANSKIFCQIATPSGVGSPGVLSVPTSTISAGSFVVNSSVGTDASTFFYVIIN